MINNKAYSSAESHKHVKIIASNLEEQKKPALLRLWTALECASLSSQIPLSPPSKLPACRALSKLSFEVYERDGAVDRHLTDFEVRISSSHELR